MAAGDFQNVGVRAVVEGFGSYMRNLGRMDSRTKGFGGTVGKLGKTAAAMGLGFVAAQASMVGIQTVMSKTIGAALKYEAQLAEIRALTGATAEDTKLLDKSIKDMARRLPKSPAELGAGAYFILSSGIEDAAEAAEVLEVAAKASVIGLGETSDVANALTTVLNAYGLAAEDAGEVTDVLIEAVKQGKAEAGAFASVLGRVVPLAAQMGISFEEVAANLATFTRLGVSADEAATGLRQVMASLLKPTEDQEEAMEELGFTAEGLRKQIREKGLLATLDAMTTATGGNEAAIARLFPNIRALTSVLGTAGVQLEDYTDILASTQNATGNLEEGLAIVSDTAQFKMQLALNELNVTLLELGTRVLPVVIEAARTLSAVLQATSGDFRGLGDIAKDAGFNLAEFGFRLINVVEGAKQIAGVASDAAGGVKSLGQSLGIFAKETEDVGAAWEVTEKAIADGVAIQIEIEQAAVEAAEAIVREAQAAKTLEANFDSLKAAISEAAQAQADMMGILNTLTGARTAEHNAIDQQINALELEENAALQAEVGQSNLGAATASTTDAIDRQIGALNNLAASFVSQALRNEITAFERELTVLQLARAEIEAQINARNRLAQAVLALARQANLPALAKQKQLELDRAKILQTVGGNTDNLTDAQKEQIATIDKEIQALQSSIDVRVLEAEAANLQAEASDENREAMQGELNELIEQIGATEDLKRQRELYIDTLVPLELLQDIDALGRQRTALGNAEAGARSFTGAIQSASSAIGDQITKLQLERDQIDLVTEGWKLQGEAMLNLPTLETLKGSLEQFRQVLATQVIFEIQAAILAGNTGLVRQLQAHLKDILGLTFAQHGFHGTVTGPQAFFIEPGRTERVDITPQGQVAGAPTLAPSAPPQAALPAAGGTDAADLATAMAFALQGMTVEMDGRVVGALVNNSLGDRTFQLTRGG